MSGSSFRIFDATGFVNKTKDFLSATTPMVLPWCGVDPSDPIPPGPEALEAALQTQSYLPFYSSSFWSLDIEFWNVGYRFGSSTAAAFAHVWINNPPNDPAILAWSSAWASAWNTNSGSSRLDATNALASIVVSDAIASLFIDYYITVVTAVRNHRAGLKIGVFDQIPVIDYGYSQSVLDHLNSRSARFAQYLDYISPDVYADVSGASLHFGGMMPSDANRVSNWINRAKTVIANARQYNKPVYIYLCPVYLDASIGFPLIEASFWAAILQTCYELADGVIIWGGYDLTKPNPTPIPWIESADWWVATQQFLALHPNVGASPETEARIGYGMPKSRTYYF